MLQAQEIDGILQIKAGGTLTKQNYDSFVPIFERIAEKKAGTVPMMIELAPDFDGWDISGLWGDIKFDVRHKDQFGRIAIIGDSKWQEWGTKIFDPLFRAEMRFFAPAKRNAAESWVRNGGSAT